nr:hypothetical protein [uncultured Shinella sp.]
MNKTAFSRRSLLAFTLAASPLWQAPARAEGFKMGLLVPGSIGKEVWNPIAFDALKRFEKEPGARISYVEMPENPAAFSVYSNYTHAAPQNVLGTSLADYGQGIMRIVSGIKDGRVPDGNVDFGLKDIDVIKFTYNDAATRPVPADLRKFVDDVSAKIVAGDIQTRAK